MKIKQAFLALASVLALGTASSAFAADVAPPVKDHRMVKKMEAGDKPMSFEEHQKRFSTRLGMDIERMQKMKTCVDASKDKEQMRACWPERSERQKHQDGERPDHKKQGGPAEGQPLIR